MAPFDPYRKWLGIPPEEQPPHHYRLLGIGLFESDPDVISNAADRQMAHLRGFQGGSYSELSQKILNELAAARLCLLDKDKKPAYDDQLRSRLAAAASFQLPAPPPHGPAAPVPPPPPPDGGGSPPVAASAVVAPIGNGKAAYAYVGRRRESAWGGAITAALVLAMIALAMVVWAMSRPSSSKPNGAGAQNPGSRHPGTATEASARVAARPDERPGADAARRPLIPLGSGQSTALSGALPQIGESLDEPVGEIRRFDGHAGPATSVAFSPEGDPILSGGEDGTLRLWGAESGSQLRTFDGPALPVLLVAFSPDGLRLISCRGKAGPPAMGQVDSWLRTTDEHTTLAGQLAWGAAFSADGKQLVLACDDGSLRLVDAATGAELQCLEGQSGPLRSAALVPRAAAGPTRANRRARFPQSKPGADDSSAIGPEVLTGGDDGKVRLWDAGADECLLTMSAHTGPVGSVAASPDGRQAVSGGADKLVWLWDLESGERLLACKGHDDAVTCLAYVPDGYRVLSGSRDGTLRLWRLADGTELRRFEAHPGGVRSVAVACNGRLAASAGNDGLVRLWRLPDFVPPADSAGPSAGHPGRRRQPITVPGDAAVKAAGDRFRNEVYRSQFESADQPDLKRSLARTLLDEAVRPQADDASAYALLTAARDLAVEVGDADLAAATVDRMGEFYTVDPIGLKIAALEGIARALTTAQPRRILAAKALAVVDEALDADDFSAASRALEMAQGLAAKVRDGPLIQIASSHAGRIRDRQQRYRAVEAARETLASSPDEPQANQVVGEYLCFVKGDWRRGLPNLAAAANPVLSQHARTELSAPSAASEQMDLADFWWGLAEERPGEAAANLKRHAAQWYRHIAPGSIGVDQAKLQERLAAADDLEADTPPPALPPISGLECRQGAIKAAMLRAFGGSEASEAAVERALAWLKDYQAADGSWSFDRLEAGGGKKPPDPGTLSAAPNAATALALMPFLAAGHTRREGQFHATVANGLAYLRNNMIPVGSAATLYEPGAAPMPSHAWGTIALCEACRGGSDRSSRAAAVAAVNFIISSQNDGGGWSARSRLLTPAPDPSDVTSTGWNLLALQAARWVDLQVPDRCFEQAAAFLDTMAADGGRTYRNDLNGAADDAAATATAMLCRVYLGWPRERQELADYVGRCGAAGPANDGKFYLDFLIQQTMRDWGGPAWRRWNPALRDHLVASQQTDGPAAGSWYVGSADWGNRAGGRLFCTAMAALTLQTYYRNPPAFR